MIGWYLHHHGAGHLQRLRAIAAQLEAEVTVFSSLPAPQLSVTTRSGPVGWIQLPEDWTPETFCPDPSTADPVAGGLLHWAPLHHRGHASRLAAIAAAATDLELMVVDVSAEVVLLARLLGAPVVAVTQPGERTDLTHQLAYRAATRILASFPGPDRVGRAVLAKAAPHVLEFAERTVFTGGISALDETAGPAQERADTVAGSRVLFVGSRGGSAMTAEALRPLLAASTFAGEVVGVPGFPWVSDVRKRMAEADVVVINAGLGSVADVARLARPAVVLAQDRPFGEQNATVRLLRGIGVVTASGMPEIGQWDALVDRALSAGGPAWGGWQVRGAADRAARAIQELVE
ncbi:hypothetical protein [Rothia kristinae]|uniref:hypothetical protein n=1 Tax=Rothia kristinae TaxID=37923 RepID=UPI00073682EE|nr:hypothetical protein [Rothia kristinae]KTR35375.1 hypothetical protein RSA5_09490 [Rothia kristinae]KTR58176.1 hypothetical protein SA11R_06170 [Rothia kristinae]KTR66872.1 hypothetical protein SA12R_07210 [Rothia kristinae]KTR73239.1 hypothetical protein SA15R_05685 [Rothia kristinae]KTR76069.1 hypothetical protein SA14R_07850 [Rothia kristinae]